MPPSSVELFGRAGSHFTRLARMFAFDAQAPYAFVPVVDMRDLEQLPYGGHPALKLPVLRISDRPLFGTENICRWFMAHARAQRTVLWPEDLQEAQYANAQELIWHGMNSQVQIMMAIRVFGMSADQPYVEKLRVGLAGALGWLDDQIEGLQGELPPHDISLLEYSLFCLFEHIRFRTSIKVDDYARLRIFADALRSSPSAMATPYGA